jgi:hypothetical protein
MQAMMRGALAGLVATAPMTVAIGAGRALGWLRTPPPAQITETVAERAGEDPDAGSPEFQAAWMAVHLGYGAACGLLYAAARPLLPRSEIAAGLLFGGAVWGVSYLGVLPGLDLFPPAEHDSRQRQAVMIAAHAVYGTSLARVERRFRAGD